jgi:hypothetical protein
MQAPLTLFVQLLIAVGATRDRLVAEAIFLVSAVVALAGLAFNISAYILACTLAVVAPTLYAGYAVHREGWIDVQGLRVLPASKIIRRILLLAPTAQGQAHA